MPAVGFFHRVAVASFIVDTLLQAIALLEDAERSLSSPSAIYVAYSPHPYAPMVFFSASVVIQVHWFLRIFSQPSTSYFLQDDSVQPSSMELPNIGGGILVASMDDEEGRGEPSDARNENTYTLHSHEFNAHIRKERETIQEPAHFTYLPLYVLGTMLQGINATMWLRRRYDYCAALSLFNSIIDVYALFCILGGSKNRRFPRSNVFTYLVVKIRIVTSLLLLWKSWGALDVLPPPGLSEGILTSLFFVSLTLSSGPDPILGLFLCCILTSFATGQHTNLGWNLMFGWASAIVLFVTVLDFIIGIESRQMLFGLTDRKDYQPQDHQGMSESTV